MTENTDKHEPTGSELIDEGKSLAEAARDVRGILEARRKWMEETFKYDAALDCLTIHAPYPYPIELSRIPDPEAVVRWVNHLAGKTWGTREIVKGFISSVYNIKGWDLHSKGL